MRVSTAPPSPSRACSSWRSSCALGDAFLARLPPLAGESFGIGHLKRKLPSGYLATLVSGENRLEDPRLRHYYEHLRRVTRGPLFAPARWGSIFALHVGRLQPGVESPDDYAGVGDGEVLELVARAPGAVGPRILWRAASHHLRAGRLGAARPVLERLARLRPHLGEDHVGEAIQIALARGPEDPEFAIALLQLLRELHPLRPEPAEVLGRILRESGRGAAGPAPDPAPPRRVRP